MVKVKSKGLVWECECGNIEYGENPPEECPECSAVATFMQVPEELIEEREEEHILSQKIEDED